MYRAYRITSRYPDDPRQPFWKEDGTPMKPLAKLTLTRQRLYKKSCGLDDVPFQELDFYDDHGNSFALSKHCQKPHLAPFSAAIFLPFAWLDRLISINCRNKFKLGETCIEFRNHFSCFVAKKLGLNLFAGFFNE